MSKMQMDENRTVLKYKKMNKKTLYPKPMNKSKNSMVSFLMLCFILSIILVGCGKKNDQTTTEENYIIEGDNVIYPSGIKTALFYPDGFSDGNVLRAATTLNAWSKNWQGKGKLFFIETKFFDQYGELVSLDDTTKLSLILSFDNGQEQTQYDVDMYVRDGIAYSKGIRLNALGQYTFKIIMKNDDGTDYSYTGVRKYVEEQAPVGYNKKNQILYGYKYNGKIFATTDFSKYFEDPQAEEIRIVNVDNHNENNSVQVELEKGVLTFVGKKGKFSVDITVADASGNQITVNVAGELSLKMTEKLWDTLEECFWIIVINLMVLGLALYLLGDILMELDSDEEKAKKSLKEAEKKLEIKNEEQKKINAREKELELERIRKKAAEDEKQRKEKYERMIREAEAAEKQKKLTIEQLMREAEEAERQRQEELERIRKEAEEAERLKQAEMERIRKEAEEAERQRKAEEERIRKEAEAKAEAERIREEAEAKKQRKAEEKRIREEAEAERIRKEAESKAAEETFYSARANCITLCENTCSNLKTYYDENIEESLKDAFDLVKQYESVYGKINKKNKGINQNIKSVLGLKSSWLEASKEQAKSVQSIKDSLDTLRKESIYREIEDKRDSFKKSINNAATTEEIYLLTGIIKNWESDSKRLLKDICETIQNDTNKVNKLHTTNNNNLNNIMNQLVQENATIISSTLIMSEGTVQYQKLGGSDETYYSLDDVPVLDDGNNAAVFGDIAHIGKTGIVVVGNGTGLKFISNNYFYIAKVGENLEQHKEYVLNQYENYYMQVIVKQDTRCIKISVF